jgi:hypothetical protein
MLRSVRHAVLSELGGLYRAAGHLALGAIRSAEADAVGDFVASDAQTQ